jgi:predicted nucleic acid-binding Zn ribbon protein
VEADWTRVRFPTAPRISKRKREVMPVYLFMCSNCGVTQQVVTDIKTEPEAPTCGICELVMVRKFGIQHIRFNGGGWGKDA